MHRIENRRCNSTLLRDACFTDIQLCPTGSIYLTMYLILKFFYYPIFLVIYT